MTMALHIILNSNDIHPRIDRKNNELYLVKVEWDEDGCTIMRENKFVPDQDTWRFKQMLLLPLANLREHTAVIESEEGEWVRWSESSQEWVRTKCPSE